MLSRSIVCLYGVAREASAVPACEKTLHDSARGAEYSTLTISRSPIKFYARCDTARRSPPGSACSPFIVQGIGQRTPSHDPRSLQVQYR
jgi:hypothetical protein